MAQQNAADDGTADESPSAFDHVDFSPVGDIEVPVDHYDFHVRRDGDGETLCGDPASGATGWTLAEESFGDYDHGPQDWVRAREDVCPTCAAAFLDATGDSHDVESTRRNLTETMMDVEQGDLLRVQCTRPQTDQSAPPETGVGRVTGVEERDSEGFLRIVTLDFAGRDLSVYVFDTHVRATRGAMQPNFPVRRVKRF
jgi:hypothetical protein